MHLAFARHAREAPDRVAATCGGASLTYGELDGESSRLAHGLLARGGGPGARVAVCLRPGIPLLVSLLAILKAGATYVPLDPDHPRERIRRILEDAAPALTLSQPDLMEAFDGVLAGPWAFPEPEPGVPAPEAPAVDTPPDLPACVFYTSGTTGQPKGIALGHGSVAYYVHSAIRLFGFGPGDRMVTIAKASFSISLFDLLGSVASGATLAILPREEVMDLPRLAAALSRSTVAHVGPALLKGLLRLARDGHVAPGAFDGVRHLSSGGDIVPGELIEGVKALFRRADVFVLYGCSEIACMGCFHPAPRDAVVDRPWVGGPFPGTRCVLLGEDGAPVPDGATGEICFSGPGLMQGYLNQPGLTARAFLDLDGDRFFRTGDLGRRGPGGAIEFLGRRDFQVKIRGQRIELLEIESHLRQAPGVRDAVCAATAAGERESRLFAYLTVEDPASFSLGPVRAWLRQRLPDYMQPAGWMVLEAMPLNENLKIARRALPPPTPGDFQDGPPHEEPRTPMERAVARIWSEILEAPRVGLRDNFFDLGGDSLTLMNVCMLAAERGILIAPGDLLRCPDLEALAAAAREETPQAAPPAAAGPLPDLPPFILRFLHQPGSRNPDAWNISRVLVARRPLSPDLLEAAFLGMGDRHDALRLRVEHLEGGWRGRILPEAAPNLSFRTVNLADLPDTQQAAAMARHARECQAGMSLARGPLACMLLFELGPGRAQELFFIVHHFVMDVVSWRNFWLEFDAAYRRLEAGRGALPPPPASFAAWASGLRAHVNAPGVVGEVEAWTRLDTAGVAPLPRDPGAGPGPNTNGSAQEVLATLPEGETLALARSRIPGATAERILLSALAFALARWQGTDTVLLDRLLHGRDAAPAGLDLSGTLGCFITYTPTLLRLDPDEPAGTILGRVSEQLDRQPGNSVFLYRHLGSDPGLLGRLQAGPRPEVLFNHRGKVDDVVDLGALFHKPYNLPGLDHDPANLRPYPLSVSADINAGRLEVRFVYSANLHRRETLEAVSGDMLHFLRRILRGPR
ncbi:MAG TPA: amino acid adenylation domain-containing protein [Holophaga sp.]|nr:amino acid adenylation domain-containing protein [Holophaga sp.]